jgi:putative endonuclease
VSGERQAMLYLAAHGWSVVAHRFRAGRVELDLVARRGYVVLFVEVKVRQGPGFGGPLEAVTGAKRREMVRAARVWIDRHGRPDDVYRFDCIGITGGRLEHVADAFRPGWR